MKTTFLGASRLKTIANCTKKKPGGPLLLAGTAKARGSRDRRTPR
jgi:hypothetical protein